MDAAESILKYIAVPTLIVVAGGLSTLLFWLVRFQIGLQGNVVKLEGNVVKLTGSMDNLSVDIRDLTATMKSEREERTELAARVGQHDVRLENLDGRLKVVERSTDRRHTGEEA